MSLSLLFRNNTAPKHQKQKTKQKQNKQMTKKFQNEIEIFLSFERFDVFQ